jgi:hypothetical protein
MLGLTYQEYYLKIDILFLKTKFIYIKKKEDELD